MYAIVRTGGKQYRVERGQRLLVERLAAKEGAEVSLEPLLYRSEEPVLDKAGLEQVQVTAKVVEHLRGKKLRVFKFKPKRGYKRRTGHRQELTRIEVTEIAAQKARRASARAGAPEGTGEAPAKPAASKRAAGADGAQKARAKPKRASAAGKATAKPARGAKVGGPAKATAKPARAAKAPPGPEPGEKAAAKPRRPAKARKDKDGA
jgi:large subunit ribosomal protein L21